MNLTPEELLQNWEKHLKIVNAYISSPRKEKLLSMFNVLEDKMITSPASGKTHFHNAFVGGYVEHVNRVVEYSLRTYQLWKEVGAEIDFTEEELVFCALVHDIGKIGDGEREGYLPQKDKWRQEKMNEYFTNNKEIPFMLIPDRTLYLLQKFEINLNYNEYLTIRIHDGLYEDINKPYFITTQPEAKLRTNLPFILHQADSLAARVEYERGLRLQPKTSSTEKVKKALPSSGGLLNIVKDL